jgi:orotate phosphoribosyltransferase
MPERWHVRLEGVTFPDKAEEESTFQALGRILLETLRFETCEDEDTWQPNPLAVRVNLVIDPEVDHLCLTLLEVPDRFESICLKTPRGWEPLEAGAPDGTFELWKALSDYCIKDTYPLESFLDYVEAGLLEIAFASHHGHLRAEEDSKCLDDFLLSSLGAIERGCDYELPCGLHSDTHVNAGRLCHSEDALHAIASSLNALFRDVEFDTIVTNGWAMGTVARRLAALRSEHTGADPIPGIMYEGYDPALPVEDVCPGGRALVLVDVVITGKLANGLEKAVRSAGSTVAGTGCLVDACHDAADRPATLRALSRMRMDLAKPGDCPRCGRLEARVFNPFAGCMTARAPGARSPTEFLAEHEEALELWEQLDQAGAYQHHKIEGNAHYTAFVDTAKLLKHEEIGPRLVERLRDLLAENHVLPGAIIAPNRQRAKLVATALKDAFEMGSRESALPLLVASLRNGRWQLPEGNEEHNSPTRLCSSWTARRDTGRRSTCSACSLSAPGPAGLPLRFFSAALRTAVRPR